MGTDPDTGSRRHRHPPARGEEEAPDGGKAPALVGYPMVDEPDATGPVAVVYTRILERMPMVPSLFKSLALCPAFLELAWDQTHGVLGHDTFREHARRLVDGAAGAVPAHPDTRIRELLGRFVGPLSRMLLVAAGLYLALDGRVDAPPAVPLGDVHDVPAPESEWDVPPTAALDAALVGAIRRDLATPVVNSVWRVAAHEGLLAEVWEHLGPRTHMPGFVDRADRIRNVASDLAGSVPWTAATSLRALDQAGVPGGAPGMSGITNGYLTTLPRVLVLVADN